MYAFYARTFPWRYHRNTFQLHTVCQFCFNPNYSIRICCWYLLCVLLCCAALAMMWASDVRGGWLVVLSNIFLWKLGHVFCLFFKTEFVVCAWGETRSLWYLWQAVTGGYSIPWISSRNPATSRQTSNMRERLEITANAANYAGNTKGHC